MPICHDILLCNSWSIHNVVVASIVLGFVKIYAILSAFSVRCAQQVPDGDHLTPHQRRCLEAVATLRQGDINALVTALGEEADGAKHRRRVALRTACKSLGRLLKVDPGKRVRDLSEFGTSFLDATMGSTLLRQHIDAGNSVVKQHIDAAKDVFIAEVQDVKRAVIRIEERTLALAALPETLRRDLQRCLTAVQDLRGLVAQLHDPECPNMFVVMPDLTPAQLRRLMAAAGSTDDAPEVGFSTRLLEAFQSSQKATWYQTHFADRRLRLRLLCGRCACPQGDGYLITQPAETLQKLAPALQVRRC